MFTLSGLILETRQNLFRDFWSPFSISFYFSSERNLKKTRTDYGPYSAWTTPAEGLYIAPEGESQPTEPNPNPSPRPRPPPEPRDFRDSPPPRFPCSFFLKKILVVVFLFRRIFRGYFLIAISDPIFVLV